MWASVTGVGWVGMGWGCGSYRAMKMIAKSFGFGAMILIAKSFGYGAMIFIAKSFEKILELERGPEAKAMPTVSAKGIRLA